MMSVDRIPPNNLEAEMAVLGSILVDREMMATVSEIVSPADFYAHVHETVFATFAQLYERGEPLDKITVAEELRNRGLLDKVGGLPYLSSLMDTVPTAASAEYYASIVREKAQLRALIHAGNAIAKLGFDGETDVSRAVADAAIALQGATQRSGKGGLRIESAAAVAQEPHDAIDMDIETILPSEDAPGLMFGPPGSLKSWLGAGACDAIVLGNPFLGFKTRQRPSALFINIDAGPKTFRNRVRSISDAPGFDFVSLPASQFSGAVLRSLLERYAGGFVVIDCLSSIYNPDTKKDPAFAMREFVDGLRALFAEFGCGGMVIDHPHRPKERGELGDYHGSIQKEAAFRTMWSIAAEPPGDTPGPRRVRIVCRKLSEGAPFSPIDVEVDFSGPRVTISRAKVTDPATRTNLLEERILEWGRGQLDAFSRRTIEQKIRGQRVSDVRAGFDALIEAGQIVPTGAKRCGGNLYRIAESATASGRTRDAVDSLGSVAELSSASASPILIGDALLRTHSGTHSVDELGGDP